MIRTMLLVLAIAASGFASDTAGLAGRVLDAQGGAVAQAQVKVLRGDGSAAASAVTGSSGEYQLEGLAPGNYVLTVEREMFRHATFNLRVAAGTNRKDVTLEVAGVNQSVVVTAAGAVQTLDEVSKPLNVISQDEITNRNDYSLGDLLTTAPGLYVENEGGPGQYTTISVRGLPSYATSVLIDGLRFRDPSDTQGSATPFIETMNIINPDHVEVMRGSASSLYGSAAAGGVVNVVTEKGGSPFHGQLQVEGGSLGMYRGRASISGGAFHDRLQYSLGLAYVNVRDGVDGHTPWRNSGTQSFLRYDLNSRMSLTGRFWGTNDFVELDSFYPTNAGIPAANLPATGTINAIALPPSQVDALVAGQTVDYGNATFIPNIWDPDYHRNSHFLSGAAVFRDQVSSTFNWQASYQYVDTVRVTKNGPEGYGNQPGYLDYGMYGGRVDTASVSGTVQPTHWFGVTAGYEFEREIYQDHQDNSTPPPDWVTTRTHAQQNSNAAYFAAQAGFLNHRLQVLLSGRAQTYDVSTPNFQYAGTGNPYAGITINVPHSLTGDAAVAYYVARTGTKFRAHVGNSFRAASLYERFGGGFGNATSSFGVVFTPYGDPNLAPDRYNSVDGGIDQYFFKDRLRVSATPFYTRIVQMINWTYTLPFPDPYGRYYGYRDVGGGISRGVETSVEVRPTKSLKITGSYTFANAGTDQDTSVPGYFRVFDTPRHTVGLVAANQWTKRLTTTLDLYHYSNTLDSYVAYGSAMLFPGYTKVNLVGSYDFWQKERRSARVYAKIDNLFNETYYIAGYREAGATAIGGVSFTF